MDMKRFFIFLLSIATLASCTRKEEIEWEPEPLPMQVEIANVVGLPEGMTFDRVEAELAGRDWELIGSVSGSWDGVTATLVLPAPIPVEGLCKVYRDSPSDYAGWWPVAASQSSDPEAKVAGLRDILAYRGDVVVGRLFLSDWDGTPANKQGSTYAYFHYADRPFVLSGNNIRPAGQPASYRYEASFVTGWNVYANVSGEPMGSNPSGTLVTTTLRDPDGPGGLGAPISPSQLDWHFEAR